MIRINLLKPEKKEIREAPSAPSVEVRKKRPAQPFGLIVLLAIAAAVGLYFHQKNQIREEQAALDAAMEEKRQLQYVLVKTEELDQQRQMLARKINLIQGLKQQQRSAVIIMDELSRHLPDWVWLTETAFSGDSVRIKGKCMSNNLLADYIFNLKSSAHFPDVRLISSTLRTVGNSQYLEFSLTATFRPPALPTPVGSESDKGVQK